MRNADCGVPVKVRSAECGASVKVRNAECGVRSKNQGSGPAVSAAMALLIAALFLLPACSKAKQQAPRVVPVLAETADRKTVPLQLKAIGNVEAYSSVAIKSLVGGEIASVYFQEGQDVNKGALLFRIDPRQYEAALRQAEATLTKDRAQLTNARTEAARYESLVDKNYVSRQEYDSIRTNAEAQAAVVSADEASVENARLQLEYTAIQAPIDGRTGAIQIKKGNIVKANDASLVTINQITPILVSFSVPEADLAAVKKYRATGGLRVEASVPQSTGAAVTGMLTFLDNAVNTGTGTILLKATFPNRERTLWPGQFVDVILTLAQEKDRVVVPTEAVQTGQQGQYVFVVKDDMTVDLRVVTAGRTFEKWTIIEKGVAAGERVVTDGQLRLTPGAKVEIKNETAQDNHGGTEIQGKTDASTKTGQPKTKP